MNITKSLLKRIITFALAILATLPIYLFGVTMLKPDGDAAKYTLRLGVLLDSDMSNPEKPSFTVTAMALILSEDGKVVDCSIDSINPDSSASEGFLTKGELEYNYGMKNFSPIEKEWFEQADYFAEQLNGKKASSLNILTDENGKAVDADLISGCTINISPLNGSFEKAMSSSYTAEFSSDTVPSASIAILTKNNSDADSVSFSFTICAAAKADGVLLSSILDALDPKVTFKEDKTFDTLDYKGTKLEQGSSYGMASLSPIGKEWYEQATFFCEYAVGMNEKQIAEIEISEAGKPQSPELLSGCTVSVSDFIKVLHKAMLSKR